MRVLEVGCGGGTHSIFMASCLLPRGGLLVSTDFSSDMLNTMKKRFEDLNVSGSFTADKRNRFQISSEEIYLAAK